MEQHNLKTIQPYFNQIKSGEKTFELRNDDRRYSVGDLICLMEFKDGALTGPTITKEITHILRNCPEYGLMPGYCILSFKSL